MPYNTVGCITCSRAVKMYKTVRKNIAVVSLSTSLPPQEVDFHNLLRSSLSKNYTSRVKFSRRFDPDLLRDVATAVKQKDKLRVKKLISLANSQ